MKQNQPKDIFFFGEAKKKSKWRHGKILIGRKINLPPKVWNESNNPKNVMIVKRACVFLATPCKGLHRNRNEFV